MKEPVLTLNNGVEMPAFGLGVYQSGPKETVAAMKTALAEGYRLIDTAAAYMTEAEVGEGPRQSGVDRSEVFVTTNLWMSDYGYDQALHAFDSSMRKLGLEQLDLWLPHWPVPSDFDRTMKSWKAAERLLSEGRVRAIGICNASPRHLEDLIARSEVVPAVNQVGLHPSFTQKALREAHARLGIATQAWSPIGGVKRYWGNGAASGDPLSHPTIQEMAGRYGKTPTQVVLRWQTDLGHSAIPKSVKPSRIVENADIFDFRLTPKEIAAIEALEALETLDSGERGGPDPERVNPQLFDFKIED